MALAAFAGTRQEAAVEGEAIVQGDRVPGDAQPGVERQQGGREALLSGTQRIVEGQRSRPGRARCRERLAQCGGQAGTARCLAQRRARQEFHRAGPGHDQPP